MKRWLSAALALTMVLCLLPTGVFSITASAATSGYYTYTVSNGEAVILSVDSSISGDVLIPSMLGGHPVTTIAPTLFGFLK